MNPFDADSDLKKQLFQNANGGDWSKVLETYKRNPAAHSAVITRSRDTALHVAVSNGEESAVKQLAAVVWEKTGRSALEKKNELGNTPLHLAAYLGNAEMCRCLAELDSTLMGIRNEDNETPFFVAVRHGRNEAFHELHSLCKPGEGYNYCRGKDGETILHSAISGEYFDLAFDIMNHYENLLNAYNEQGFSPLHILANKPSAFRSGSHVRGLHKLIYHCIFVDELQPNTLHRRPVDLEYKEGSMYPKNYHACIGMFSLLWNIIWVLLGHSSDKNDEESNIHNEHHGQETTKEHQHNKEHSRVMALCGRRDSSAERDQSKKVKEAEGAKKRKAQGHEFLPINCITFFNFIKLLSKAMLVILGLGSKSVEKMREKKAKHIWSVQIMEKLLEHASYYEYEYNGKSPGILDPSRDRDAADSYTLSNTAGAVDLNPTTIQDLSRENPISDAPELPSENPNLNNPKSEGTNLPPGKCGEVLCALLDSMGMVKNSAWLREICPERGGAGMEMEKRETPVLIAAKNGVVEMVEGILKRFSVAIHDMNSEQKNVVLLAVEHRQPHVYKFLLECKTMKETVFRKTDKDGNSALHLAARLGKYRPWLIPGAALQMQWEIKWYEFVKDSMPLHFFPRHNNLSQTPRDIFSKTHGELAKEGGAWLTNTSQSCSVVAALIATVAFATSATVPGGVKSDNSGTPTLQNQPAFSIFAISSLVALCFSVTSVVMFLSILTSRFEEKDFGIDLPRKLLIGLTSLFISIGSMLLSFCAGHFFVLKEKLQYAAFPMYAITCLPVTFFAIGQFPLYFDLVWATIRKVPQRSSK